MRKNILSNIFGFSMVGAITAAGLMGGLALILAQMSRQQLVLQKRAQTWSETEALAQRIGRILYNPQACLNTLATVNFHSGITTSTTISLSSIKNKSNRNVIQINQTYGNGLVKVSSLILKNINFIGSTNSGNIKLTFQVTLEKTSKAIDGYKKAIRTYDLAVKTNPPFVNNPVSCATDISDAVEEICKELGREYDPNLSPGSRCKPFAASLNCPTTGDMPIGFEATGYTDGVPDGVQLKCASPPTTTLPHPVGYNCFLYKLYDNPSTIFEPIYISLANLDNSNSPTGATSSFPAVTPGNTGGNSEPLTGEPSNPSRPRVVTLLNRWKVKSGYSSSVTPCPAGYTHTRYINPINSEKDYQPPGGGTLLTMGSDYGRMRQYCCK